MAQIRPFHGIHYNPSRIEDLSKVVIPPYDVISPEEQCLYHDRHPYNFIRLAFGETLPDDDETWNRYTRAARYLEAWLQEGILVRDDVPSLYGFEQPYRFRDKILVRRGLIGLVRLEPYEKGIVLPHEKTFTTPKADRLHLMRQTCANLDSVFGLYEDRCGAIAAILQAMTASPPLLEFPVEGAGWHRLWRVSERDRIDSIRKDLEESQILIADGHHRYETALTYRDERRAAGSLSEAEDFVLMTLVDTRNEGLTVLPTHRLVRCASRMELSEVLESLRPCFAIQSVHRDALRSLIREETEGHPIGFYAGQGQAFRLTLTSEGIKAMDRPGATPFWQELDTAILHILILNDIFGIDFDQNRRKGDLTYLQDEEAALSAVDSGEASYAFLLRPAAIPTIWKVSRARERMPPKSTYFYPKLLTGVLMRRLE